MGLERRLERKLLIILIWTDNPRRSGELQNKDILTADYGMIMDKRFGVILESILIRESLYVFIREIRGSKI